MAIIRRVRPQVIVTYPDARGEYDHPDHVQVHDISVPAFHAAGDPERYPEAGPAWQPSKLYYTMWSRARIAGLHAKFLELGIESPYDEWWFERPSSDHLITTQVPIAGHWDVRGEGAACPRHADRPGVEVLVRPARRGGPHQSTRSTTTAWRPATWTASRWSPAEFLTDGPIEDDLFAGVRAEVPMLMAEFSFLSEEWIAALAEGGAALPERPGVDGVVRFVMTSTPHGKVQFRSGGCRRPDLRGAGGS